MNQYFISILFLTAFMSPIVDAKEQDEQIDFLDPYIEKLRFDPFRIGGSVAFAYNYADYGNEDTGAGELDFSRVKLSLSFNYEAYSAYALYDFYYYDNPGRWVHWLQLAWLNYAFSPDHQVRIGINKVPFGLLPYSSVSWYENLSYYVGLTDDNDLGIKYMGKFGLWDIQLAYYLGHEGSYSGESDDSARYSFDVARDAGAENEEKNLFDLRLAYNYTYNTEAKAEWVLSLQYGQIHNLDTNQNGDHYAFALHMDAYYG